MADSIPSLRRKLAEAQAKIAELERRPAAVEVVKEVKVPVEVERVVYRDREVQVLQPPEVITKVIEIQVEKEVVRYETVEVVREVYVTDPVQEQTIRELQERLREWQSISQQDL